MNQENFSDDLSRAAIFLADKNYFDAKNEFQKVLKKEKNNLEALKGIGLCFYNLKEYDNSIKAFKKAVKIAEDDATSLYYLASLSILLDKSADAIIYSKKVIELRPDYFDAYKILFTLYLKLKKFDAILDLYKIFKDNNVVPTDETIYVVLGTLYMLKKSYEIAIEFFKSAQTLAPKKEQISNNLGVCYMSLKDYDMAIQSFENSLLLNSNNHLTYIDLGTVYQMKGEFVKALNVFNKALELAPDNFLVLLNVANLSNMLKRYDLAIDAYEKILSINHNLKEIQSSLIGAYVKNRQHDKAINLIDKVLEKNQRNVPLLFKKAKIYTDLNDFNSAAKIYEQIVSFKKNSPTIYHAYAILYTKMKDYDKALQYLQKSLVLEENNAQAHKDLGVIYLMRNQVEYAKDEFDKAAQLGTQDNEILKECGDFYYSISNFQKADDLYRKSLEIENNPYTSLSLGINLIAQNKLEEAFAVMEPLLSIFPDNPELLYNLARIFYYQKDFDNAARLAKKAYFKIPTIEIANLLALCLKSLNDYKGAAGIFEKILIEYPLNIFVYNDLIDCYRFLNDTENLIKTYYMAIENLPYDEKRGLELVELLYKTKKINEAKKVLDKMNFEHPSANISKYLAKISQKEN